MRKQSRDEPVKVFVYGTLMPGHYYHRHVKRYVRRWRYGTIRGRLIDVGWYPALAPGEGVVRGVLLETAFEALRVMDHIEAYDAERNAGEYLRKRCTVSLAGGGETSAWTYEFSEPVRLADRPELLHHHDDGIPVYGWAPNEQPDPARLKRA